MALSALDLVLTRGSPPPCKALFDAALSVAALEFGVGGAVRLSY